MTVLSWIGIKFYTTNILNVNLSTSGKSVKIDRFTALW